MAPAAPAPAARRRRWPVVAVALVAVALLCGLGVWQVERLQWKEALIARVDARIHARPVPAPPPAAWAGIDKTDAYLKVRVRGHYVAGADTRVKAVTDLGGGSWVLTPFVTDAGWTLLIDRGFVPDDVATPPAPTRPATVTGLLRVTEPGGAFLRDNQPAADRWFSRDVAAIARARNLGRIAPYFVDADRDRALESADGWPRGGMTVIRFPNNHLLYAITWFTLAALIAWLTLRALRRSDDGDEMAETGGPGAP